MSSLMINGLSSLSRNLVLAGFMLVLTTSCLSNDTSSRPGNAECPQPRFTGKAPDSIYNRTNPVAVDSKNLELGRQLFEQTAEPSCSLCHGKKGDGRGPLSTQFDPRPRNFACRQTVTGIPDGQLFWIIKYGSAGTAMPSFDYLGDSEIWQLVLHLRSLAGQE